MIRIFTRLGLFLPSFQAQEAPSIFGDKNEDGQENAGEESREQNVKRDVTQNSEEIKDNPGETKVEKEEAPKVETGEQSASTFLF